MDIITNLQIKFYEFVIMLVLIIFYKFIFNQMATLKDIGVSLDQDLRYLNFKINEVFYKFEESTSLIEVKFCKKIFGLDI